MIFRHGPELGTLNLIQQNPAEAEKAYLQAIEVRPKFFLALMALGKLRVAEKKYKRRGPVDSRAGNPANFRQP